MSSLGQGHVYCQQVSRLLSHLPDACLISLLRSPHPRCPTTWPPTPPCPAFRPPSSHLPSHTFPAPAFPTPQVFYHVAPDPTLSCIEAGLKEMLEFKPDVIIAMGGGSPMDAAKVMWLMYEVRIVVQDDSFFTIHGDASMEMSDG